MEKKLFKNLVITGFIKSLTLSVTGLIDCVLVGRFLGADSLCGIKLAMPVYSIFSLFSFVLSAGLSVAVKTCRPAGETAPGSFSDRCSQ